MSVFRSQTHSNPLDGFNESLPKTSTQWRRTLVLHYIGLLSKPLLRRSSTRPVHQRNILSLLRRTVLCTPVLRLISFHRSTGPPSNRVSPGEVPRRSLSPPGPTLPWLDPTNRNRYTRRPLQMYLTYLEKPSRNWPPYVWSTPSCFPPMFLWASL